MEKLKEELFRLEPKIDLLHDLLGLGRFAEITMTSDGFYLGRKEGDIGFNDFLGIPSDAAVKRTKTLFKELSKKSQEKVLFIFQQKGFPVELLRETSEVCC